MKFSHSIQFNAVPDWSSHYVAYSALKKLIYQLEKTAHTNIATDTESRPLIDNNDPEEVFSRALDVELEKVVSFYVSKEGELFDEVNQLLGDVSERESVADDGTQVDEHNFAHERGGVNFQNNNNGPRDLSDSREHLDDDSDDDDDDETVSFARSRTGLSRRKTAPMLHTAGAVGGDMTASSEFTRLGRRRSTTATDLAGEHNALYASGLFNSAIMLKKRITSLYVQLSELKSYAQLNRTGFSKVLKKFDKTIDRELRPKYLATFVDPAYPFKRETIQAIEEQIKKIENAYAEVVTDGDEELARRDLKTHLREHVVWERNTVWRELIGLERRAEAASLGRSLLGPNAGFGGTVLRSDDKPMAAKKLWTPFGSVSLPTWLTNSTIISLLVAIALFFGILHTPLLDKPEQQNCLAMLVFVSFLWATEAIPLFVTSLMIPFLSVLLRVISEDDPQKHTESQTRLNAKQATAFVFASMWTPVIMLLMGGFTLAAALSKCKIDKILATFVLSKAGTKPRTVLIANMFVAAFASMLISNVAAPVLCFSIIEPMLRTLPSDSSMSKAVIMGIALASNVGGMLSPIASPQNIVAMQNMSPEPSWGQWFFIVIPVGVVSILLIWVLLLVTFQPGKDTNLAPIRQVKEEFTLVQWFVTLVTFVTIVLWLFSSRLEHIFGDMGVISIIPIVLFFGTGILTKEDFNNFPWTIIMLAAGGLSLGKAVRSSGLLHAVGTVVSHKIQGVSLYGVLVVFSSLILVIATFISHTVAALIILPLVAKVGKDMDDPKPNLLVMAGVLMCSAAMGLPTSGFPNMTAIMKEDATGQRYLRVSHFISRGVPSSLLALLVVITLGYGAMELANID